MSPFRIGRRGALHAGLGLLGPPLLTACGGALRAVTNEAQPRQATAAPAAWALVLSGGGLRGFAHLGVLRGLRSLGLAPPLTVGSSVGAVIGGLYASGAALEGAESMVMSPELDPLGQSADFARIAQRCTGRLAARHAWKTAARRLPASLCRRGHRA